MSMFTSIPSQPLLNFICRELSKAVEPYIKQEDEGKFRCKTCQKLFKATSFVEKHIANKHPDHVKHLEEVGSKNFWGSSYVAFSDVICLVDRYLISTASPLIRIGSSRLVTHPLLQTATAKRLHRRRTGFKDRQLTTVSMDAHRITAVVEHTALGIRPHTRMDIGTHMHMPERMDRQGSLPHPWSHQEGTRPQSPDG